MCWWKCFVRDKQFDVALINMYDFHVFVIKANQILAVLLHICCHHGQKSAAAIKLVAAVLSSIKKKKKNAR